MQTIVSRRHHLFLSCFLASIFLSGCNTDWRGKAPSADSRTFVAQFWKTPLIGADYPEMKDEAIYKRPSFGVAFQGGGNRAAPAALGQLRALHDLGWINKVRYISAISGGAWTAIPYTFLKACSAKSGIDCNQSLFLGISKSPAEVARRLPKLAGEKKLDEFKQGSMLGAIADGAVTDKVINAWIRGRFDESYSDALGEIYLKPFGLGRKNRNDPDSLFTWRETDRNRIRSQNLWNPTISGSEIHYVELDRPYLIVGGVVLTKRTLVKPDGKFRMEMTPLYTGVPRDIEYPPHGRTKFRFGGGFVESFGYDYVTEKVDQSGEITELTLRDPRWGNRSDKARLNFSLANMAAVTGAAPVETAVSIRVLRFLAANFGFPEHFAPVDRRTPKRSRISAGPGEDYEKEWAHGDGGHEDNLGLAPLLARQVENILVFANSVYPLNGEMIGKCEAALKKLDPKLPEPKELNKGMKNCIKMIGSDIPSFFVKTDSHIHNVGLSLRDSSTPDGRKDLSGYYDLLKVAQQLQNEDHLSCKRYNYKPQGNWSQADAERQSYSPKICFLYLSLDNDWVEQIRIAAENEGMNRREIRAIQDTLDLDGNLDPIAKKRRGVGSNGFPHIGTFFDQPAFLIKTAKPRLYALYNFTAWKLKKSSAAISEAFAENDLTLTLPK